MATTGEVASRLSVSRSTVRAYGGELADYLSAGATPEPGQARQFSEEDLRVMATARDLLGEGLTYDQVRERLAQGLHLVDLPEVEPKPPHPEPPPASTSTALVSPDQIRAMLQPLAAAAEEWQAIAESRRQEAESLREENRRLREELARPWWRRLLGR